MSDDPHSSNHHKRGGCLFSNEPSDLPKFGAVRKISTKDLPRSADLRKELTPVENQLNFSSCVGNALAGAYEFLIKRNTGKHIDVSRLFIYYNARVIDLKPGQKIKDEGTLIRSAIKALESDGCCKEKSFQYNVDNINKKPPQYCYDEARNHRIISAKSINSNLDEMKACLAEGYPFAFGLMTYPSFNEAENNGGRVPTPTHFEIAAHRGEGHAMLAVGYNDTSKCFIVRNSYGSKWGDGGYCYIRYDYMQGSRLCQDMHVIYEIEANSRERDRNRDRQRDEEKQREIQNPFDWTFDEDNFPFTWPHHQFNFFDYRRFWEINDTFDYFHSLHGCHTAKRTKNFDYDNNAATHCILWIDNDNDDNQFVINKLMQGSNFEIDFYDTFKQATDYLRKNQNQIRSNGQFSIVCRGYYRNENKNPVDLIQFLDKNGLNGVPVFVFTTDRGGVQHHIEKQASASHLFNWQRRLVIIDNGNELVDRITNQ